MKISRQYPRASISGSSKYVSIAKYTILVGHGVSLLGSIEHVGRHNSEQPDLAEQQLNQKISELSFHFTVL